jgi:hypothetical protein
MTEADVLQFFEHHHAVSPSSRRLRFFTFVLASVTAGVASYWVRRGWESILWAGFAALLVGTTYRWGGPALNRAFWKRGLREGKRALFGRQTLSLEAEGLRCTSAAFEGLLRWEAIDRIEADEHHLYFMMTGGGSPVPRAAFQSVEDSDAFLAKARELHRSAEEQAARFFP